LSFEVVSRPYSYQAKPASTFVFPPNILLLARLRSGSTISDGAMSGISA
jgi:hypothetical protein